MSFYGSQFVFDGVPCSDYGLMLYEVGSGSDTNGKLSTGVKIIEDRITRRHTPLHYGITYNSPLVFSLTFGVDTERIDTNQPLDRWEMESISSWLTGHDEYKYLEIIQSDMNIVRYKCIITNLEYITYGNIPWAFKCEVTCDSPFAYMLPQKKIYTINGSLTADFHNYASCKHYFPKLKIKINEGTSFSVVNHSDNDREFLFDGIPSAPIEINVDNENEIITNSKQINLYDCFNFTFFRLIKGRNNLEFAGNAQAEIICEFPVSIGG